MYSFYNALMNHTHKEKPFIMSDTAASLAKISLAYGSKLVRLEETEYRDSRAGQAIASDNRLTLCSYTFIRLQLSKL